MPRSISTLLVVSHVVHYKFRNRLFAYAPYAREIDVWADLFPRLLIAAPCREDPPPGDAAPILSGNVAIAPQLETGGTTLSAKVAQLVTLPRLAAGLARAMWRADAVHVRCPGNLGLLGAVMAPLFSRHLVAKYAGQWNGGEGEARTVRLQKAVLRSAWWRGPVTVYGEWPDQPRHIMPFFTSVLERAQIDRARDAAVRPRRTPATVLFVGRLSKAKNVDVLLRALGSVLGLGIRCRAVVAGDGPERHRLERLAASLGIDADVSFLGAISFDRVLELYEESDVLVLASETEGWPKAITEAMAFGLVCIGSDRGLVPRILSGDRGLVVPPRDAAALAETLARVLTNPHQYDGMRARAAAWGQQYSLETLRNALSRLLDASWGPAFQPPPARQAAAGELVS